MPQVRFSAFSRKDRHAAISDAAEAIREAGGSVDDHTLFSDLMAVLQFSVSADRVGELRRNLAARGLAVETDKPDEAEVMGRPDAEVSGALTVHFLEGGGDHRREVPPFNV